MGKVQKSNNSEYKFSSNVNSPSRMQWSADTNELHKALPAIEVLEVEATIFFPISL
jgi:hypothetical protein